MSIILCGLPGCGKTTYGFEAAALMQWEFVDTDRLIEMEYESRKKSKFSCREIFHLLGERDFRLLEKSAIYKLKDKKQGVIALGGGSFSDPGIISFIKGIGHVVYLKTPLSILLGRLHKNGLPAFLDPLNPDDSFKCLAKKRQPIYEKACDFFIDTSFFTKDEVIQTIIYLESALSLLKTIGKE